MRAGRADRWAGLGRAAGAGEARVNPGPAYPSMIHCSNKPSHHLAPLPNIQILPPFP